MLLLVLEALAALAIAIFIVWWTMFSGRVDSKTKKQDNDDKPGDE